MSEQEIKDKRTMYKLVFGSEYGKEVLDDLGYLCNENRSHFVGANDVTDRIDALELARREGRREVFVEIRKMLADEPIYIEEEIEEEPLI